MGDINDIQEVLQFFDTRGDGKIAVNQVGCCLRSLGLTPTQQEIAILTQQWPIKESRLSIEELTPIYRNLKKEHKVEKSVEELADCLTNFDREGNGQILIHDLRFVLTTCGEKLSEEEVDILLQGQESSEGKINIHDFIQMITLN